MNRIETRRHVLAVLPRLLGLLLLFLAFLGAFLVLFWKAPELVLAHILCQMGAIITGMCFIYSFLDWQCYSVVVTPQCVVEKWGIIFRRSRNYDLASAVLDTRQGPLARLLNLGDLIITLVHNSETIAIRGLSEFRTVCRVLESRAAFPSWPERVRPRKQRPTAL
jgi:membrane protein YdbS with pleckstrin-like domain